MDLNDTAGFYSSVKPLPDGPLRPESSFENYEKTVKKAVSDFTHDNFLLEALTTKKFTILHYHRLLKSLFHQVYFSSTSFAMAGGMASLTSYPIRSYLLRHAEEEKDHWVWILEDLKSTGYAGPDIRNSFPNWATQAYLSYGIYLAVFNPVARLAMAHVLEGISGSFGTRYGNLAVETLRLRQDQMKFFLAHGELDKGHSHEIAEVLKAENLNAQQWAELEHVAQTTSQLYKNIYNLAFAEVESLGNGSGGGLN